jgi:hypothetical protein
VLNLVLRTARDGIGESLLALHDEFPHLTQFAQVTRQSGLRASSGREFLGTIERRNSM